MSKLTLQFHQVSCSELSISHFPPSLLPILKRHSHSAEMGMCQAYRKLALAKHPDRGGDPAEFARVSKAYEVGSK